jgi:hypothetical protein
MELPYAINEILNQRWPKKLPQIWRLVVLHEDEVSISIRVWTADSSRPVSIKSIKLEKKWIIQQG